DYYCLIWHNSVWVF
nr:immunoglobulin light chain junction region [Macaca mulatta]